MKKCGQKAACASRTKYKPGWDALGRNTGHFNCTASSPDIVTIGKPLGNGHPIAAVAVRRDIAEAFANGMEYFNTFGGNPVSCAIAHEVLKVVHDENLQANAQEVGNYLLEQLRQLQTQYPLIGEVRGSGLFLGDGIGYRSPFAASGGIAG
jgi:4-aminobutyrate aminotransferase-like enzyme